MGLVLINQLIDTLEAKQLNDPAKCVLVFNVRSESLKKPGLNNPQLKI